MSFIEDESYLLNGGRELFTANHADALVNNAVIMRRQLMQMFGDKRRNIEQECGYTAPENRTSEDYRKLFDAEPVAARVVIVFPSECWQVCPWMYEDEDLENETEFEKAWDELGRQVSGIGLYRGEEGNPIWEYLERADVLSGIGQYGVIILGVDDGKALDEPLDLIELDKLKSESPRENVENAKPRKLLYLTVLDERDAPVSAWEQDSNSPRFMRPTYYTITINNSNNSNLAPGDDNPSRTAVVRTIKVHWTRVVHIADNLQAGSESLGTPRMQQVYNRLYDLHKLYGGSAEMFWKGAFPGLSFETHPQLGGQVKIDKRDARSQYEKYINGLDRAFMIPGLEVKSLAPQVADPTAHIDAELEAICIMIGCPKRVFLGSERGELSSEQDIRAWYSRVKRRQNRYLTPRVISTFIEHLIKARILPMPKQYSVMWPDVASVTETEKATISLQRTQALAAFIGGGGDAAMSWKDFWVRIAGFTEKEAEAIIEAKKEEIGDEDALDVHEREDELAQQEADQAMQQGDGDKQFQGTEADKDRKHQVQLAKISASAKKRVGNHGGQQGKVPFVDNGGAGSGNFGHKGRPGKEGGSSKSGIEEFEIIGYGRQKFEAYVNPTRAQALNWLQRYHKDGIRGIVDPSTGDKYIWRAYEATHQDVIDALNLDGDAIDELTDFLIDTHSDIQLNLDSETGEDAEGIVKEWFSGVARLTAKGKIVANGGKGSGNFGHAGRPGQEGGSAPGDGSNERNKLSVKALEAMSTADHPIIEAALPYSRPEQPGIIHITTEENTTNSGGDFNVLSVQGGNLLPESIRKKLAERDEPWYRVIYDAKTDTWHIPTENMSEVDHGTYMANVSLSSEDPGTFTPADLTQVRGLYDAKEHTLSLYDFRDQAEDVARDADRPESVVAKIMDANFEKAQKRVFYSGRSKMKQIDILSSSDVLGNHNVDNGGPGSGNFGHEGRPGFEGGSAPDGNDASNYSQTMRGEWWLEDGTSMFADGDIGDMNHEGFVIDRAQREIADSLGDGFEDMINDDGVDWNSIVVKLEEDNDAVASGLTDNLLKSLEIDPELFEVATGNGDVRAYAVEKWGWTRVAGNDVQTGSLTTRSMKQLADGLGDAYQEEVDTQSFNVETKTAYYTEVPFPVLESGDVSALREYKQHNTPGWGGTENRVLNWLRSLFGR